MPRPVNQPIVTNYKMKIEKNVYVPMRDGIRLAVDIYRPDTPSKFPALLGMSPFGKAIQTLPYPFPQPAPDYISEFKTALWDGCPDVKVMERHVRLEQFKINEAKGIKRGRKAPNFKLFLELF
jgi:hypothetical protein